MSTKALALRKALWWVQEAIAACQRGDAPLAQTHCERALSQLEIAAGNADADLPSKGWAGQRAAEQKREAEDDATVECVRCNGTGEHPNAPPWRCGVCDGRGAAA